MRVLLCDDSLFMRRILQSMLIKLDPDIEVVAQAGNGKDAVELYKIHRPDLVTLDITMPVMGGIEALKEIKKIDPDAMIAMVSAIGQQPTIIEAIRSGACDFIIKPFTKERLMDLLRRIDRHKTHSSNPEN